MSDLTADSAIDAAFDSSPAPSAPEAPPAAPSPAPAPETPPGAPAAAASQPDPPSDDMADVPRSPAPKTPPPVAAAQKAAEPTKDPILESKNIAQIRKAYEARGLELKTAREEAAKWQKDFNDARKAGYTEAESKYKADLEAANKRAQELDTQVKYTAFERSEEFKTQYQKPISEAWTRTMEDLKGVKILDSNGNETEETATSQHVVQLCQMSGIQAAKQAKAWFGDAATEVLAHRRQILELNQKKDAAIKEWNEKGSEMTAAKEKEEAARQSEVDQQLNSNLVKFTDIIPGFKPPQDTEALGFHKAGLATVALALKGEGLPPGLTESQIMTRRVEAQAKMIAKSIAYGPVAHENMKLKAELEALKTELLGYKKSTPKPSADVHQPASGHTPSAEEIIDSMKEFRG